MNISPMDFVGNLARGVAGDVVVKTIRATLNEYLRRIPLSQVIVAVGNNTSLWSVAGEDIRGIANKIPPKLIQSGLPMYRNAIAQYGNATGLVLVWIKEDNPPLLSLLENTNGGIEWLDQQVREMTGQLGLDYSV